MVDETAASRETTQRATCRDEGESPKAEIAFNYEEDSTGNETCRRPCRGCAHRHGERLWYRVGWCH